MKTVNLAQASRLTEFDNSQRPNSGSQCAADPAQRVGMGIAHRHDWARAVGGRNQFVKQILRCTFLAHGRTLELREQGSRPGDVEDVGENSLLLQRINGGHRLRHHRAADEQMDNIPARLISRQLSTITQSITRLPILLAAKPRAVANRKRPETSPDRLAWSSIARTWNCARRWRRRNASSRIHSNSCAKQGSYEINSGNSTPIEDVITD